MNTAPKRPPLSIRIDWRAYFRTFQSIHGEPIQTDEETLLFPDGWRYSAKFHHGPEQPPPDDAGELHRLQRTYWSLRRRIVEKELARIQVDRENVMELQAAKSVPLQMRMRVQDGSGKITTTIDDFDPDLFAGQIISLRAWLEQCDEKLKGLENA